MSIDLHIHTTASDGNIDPVTVVRMAAEAGLTIIALADHETTSGFQPARDEAEKQGISIIPAVELLTYHKDREVHLLGYLPDPDHRYLQKNLAELRNKRTMAARETVKKLAEFGYRISWSDILKMTHQDGPVSKGHIIRAAGSAGYIKDGAQAFDFVAKYLNPGGLAYTSYDFSFEDGVQLIRDVGGVPVLAHPGLIKDDAIVADLCEKGIRGMEVYYNYFGQQREKQVQKYSAKAEEKGLIKTGGSDYHGTITPVILGENPVPYAEVTEFLQLFDLI